MADKRGTDAAEPSPAATDPTEAPASPELDTLKRERDDYHDRWLRKTAEFDNYRRRVERERREQADQSVIDLLQEVLLVVDDFDRALTVEAGEGAGAYGRASSSFTPLRPAAEAGVTPWTVGPTSTRTCIGPSSESRARPRKVKSSARCAVDT